MSACAFHGFQEGLILHTRAKVCLSVGRQRGRVGATQAELG